MAAEGEEVVARPHPLHPGLAEHLRPETCQHLLDRSLRRDVGRSRFAGSGRGETRQGAAVGLAVGGQRQALQQHEAVGHHVVGKHPAQPLRQVCGRGAHQVSHQALVPRRVLAHQHHRLAHARLASERRLDLPQLDAEAPHLDLVIQPAQILDVAVRQQARQVAGAVEPASRLGPERIGDEHGRRQVRPPPGSRGRGPGRRAAARPARRWARPPAPGPPRADGGWRSAGRSAPLRPAAPARTARSSRPPTPRSDRKGCAARHRREAARRSAPPAGPARPRRSPSPAAARSATPDPEPPGTPPASTARSAAW